VTAVRVNTHSYATVHVASNILRGIRQIVRLSGLSTAALTGDWEVLERGCATWLRSGDLRALVLEVYDPSLPSGADLVGRFDFDIDYGYYPGGDGELWLDPDTVAWTVRKNGSYPSSCRYRVVADTRPGRPDVDGWSRTDFRSTDGFVRQVAGAATGGGALGAQLAYYRRTT
jgi:hypothetical protein